MQHKPRRADGFEKLGEARNGDSPAELCRECGPADNLDFGLLTSRLGEFKFLLFEVTRFMVIVTVGPRNRLQAFSCKPMKQQAPNGVIYPP